MINGKATISYYKLAGREERHPRIKLTLDCEGLTMDECSSLVDKLFKAAGAGENREMGNVVRLPQ